MIEVNALFNNNFNSQHLVCKLRDDGRMMGSCICTVYHNGQARVMLVDSVFVGEPFRRNGYGEELVTKALELADLLGVDSVELVVNRDNGAARGLYSKMGFEETDKIYCRKLLNLK